jgi:prephenate dehydratase
MGDSALPRVGYLGPAGTFSEEALQASARPGSYEPVAIATIYDTVAAVRDGAVRWAVVPIENSLDGSVTVTLDLLAETGISAAGGCLPASVETGISAAGGCLPASVETGIPVKGGCPPPSAGEQGDLEVVGEALLAVRHALIAAEPVALDAIDTVLSHPQVPGQCTRLLRGELAHARVLPANSTAEAVRIVSTSGARGQAALGTRLAADIYGGTVIRDGVQDRDDNVTRFVWLARGAAADATTETNAPTEGGAPGAANAPGPDLPPLAAIDGVGWKTSVVFWGPGADSPGWLVGCLNEFARREINLTKIESRPRRGAFGHYMFFVDLEGDVREERVAEAVAGLRETCEHVRVLGSYPRA